MALSLSPVALLILSIPASFIITILSWFGSEWCKEYLAWERESVIGETRIERTIRRMFISSAIGIVVFGVIFALYTTIRLDNFNQKTDADRIVTREKTYTPSPSQQRAIDNAKKRSKKKANTTSSTSLELSDETMEYLYKKHVKPHMEEYWKNHLDSVKNGLIE
jgi:hypothetical protein